MILKVASLFINLWSLSVQNSSLCSHLKSEQIENDIYMLIPFIFSIWLLLFVIFKTLYCMNSVCFVYNNHTDFIRVYLFIEEYISGKVFIITYSIYCNTLYQAVQILRYFVDKGKVNVEYLFHSFHIPLNTDKRTLSFIWDWTLHVIELHSYFSRNTLPIIIAC